MTTLRRVLCERTYLLFRSPGPGNLSRPRQVRALVLGILAILLVQQLGMGQELDAGKVKRLKIAGVDGQPAFILHISARGREGLVSVRDEQGIEKQALVCALLRAEPDPTQFELEAVREQFVLRFEALDLDSDGHKDLRGVREFGAKWARYCVWLYDPKKHIFIKDFLAGQMELLANLEAIEYEKVATSSMGPLNPSWAVYRIVSGKGSGPERQLIAHYSCLVKTTTDVTISNEIVTTRYEGGQAVVQRQKTVNMDANSALQSCISMERLQEKSHAKQ